MIAGTRILPRAPLLRGRGFGVTDPSWPRHRGGSPNVANTPRAGGADRHLRARRDVATPAPATAAAINLTVNHLTLSPRFRLLWQTWQTAGTRIERLERASVRDLLRESRATSGLWRTLAERTARTITLRRPGQQTRATIQPPRSAHPVPAPTTRARPGSHTLRLVQGSSRREAQRVSVTVSDLRQWTSRRFATLEHRVARHRTLTVRAHARRDAQERRVTRHSNLTVRHHAQRLSERLDTRASRVLTTRIAHHWLAGPGASPGKRPAADGHAIASAELRVLAAAGRPPGAFAPAPSHPGRPRDPAERAFRAAPRAATPAAPGPTPAPRPTPQPAPPTDIAKLDAVLWQRFEKRLRIEQERRGRI